MGAVAGERQAPLLLPCNEQSLLIHAFFKKNKTKTMHVNEHPPSFANFCTFAAQLKFFCPLVAKKHCIFQKLLNGQNNTAVSHFRSLVHSTPRAVCDMTQRKITLFHIH